MADEQLYDEKRFLSFITTNTNSDKNALYFSLPTDEETNTITITFTEEEAKNLITFIEESFNIGSTALVDDDLLSSALNKLRDKSNYG